MKKLIMLLLIIVSFYIGYTVGSNKSEREVVTDKEVVDVTASDAGVQINYNDGTGYWYEYQGGK